MPWGPRDGPLKAPLQESPNDHQVQDTRRLYHKACNHMSAFQTPSGCMVNSQMH